MLVLTRKIGEIVRVGGDVTVQVLEIKAGQVKLGLEAPRRVQIYREEVYKQIEAENLRALLPDRDVLGLACAALEEKKHGRS